VEGNANEVLTVQRAASHFVVAVAPIWKKFVTSKDATAGLFGVVK